MTLHSHDFAKLSLFFNLFSQPDINECESSPCSNEATCVDDVNGYTCNCIAGYTGTHCETGVDLMLTSEG